MPITPDPLLDMAMAVNHDDQQIRPDETFLQTALPGFKQALQARRSMRVFDGKPIPEDTMRDCLADAILAPSSSNLETYEFYWVRDPEKKQALTLACLGQPAVKTAGELIVAVARTDLWDINRKKLIELMTKGGRNPLAEPVSDYYNQIVPMLMKNDRFGIRNVIRRLLFWYKSRHQAFIRTPVNQGDHRIYGHIQAALAAQTLMLSIAAHGYESCAIGGMDCVRIAKILELPDKAEITFLIAAGRGKAEGLYGPRIRLAFDDLIREI